MSNNFEPLDEDLDIIDYHEELMNDYDDDVPWYDDDFWCDDDD